MVANILLMLAEEDGVVSEVAADRRRAVAADVARYTPYDLLPIPTSAILLIAALAEHDGATYVHSLQVARRACLLAQACSQPAEEISRAFLAGLLHDIGMLTVRRSLLQKPTPLTPAEWALLRTHPEAGARILQLYPELQPLQSIILGHHERPDGLGYPYGRRLEEIPLLGRVVGLSESIEAMSTRRPYAPPMRIQEIALELTAGAGTIWDAQLVALILPLLQGEGTQGVLTL